MKKELFSLKESKRYPGLFVRKYDRRVFYDNLWDEKLRECRGHVEDVEGNTVIYPFTKIFNRFENDTDIDLNENVLAVQKINGFMAAVTWVPSVQKCIVSTTGSLDSPYVDMATEMIPASVFDCIEKIYKSGECPPATYLFEIVHPNDPHIIPELCGSYLIGCRALGGSYAPYSTSVIGEYLMDSLSRTDMKGVLRPNWFCAPFEDVVKLAEVAKHEGFVVYGDSNTLKIKTPYYLITKFLGRMSKAKLDQIARNPLSFRQRVDEEFYPLLDHINDCKGIFIEFDDQERMAFIRSFLNRMTKYV